jgi:hypothetical protein
MTTLVIKDDSLHAHQFLAFARTLPYIDIIENKEITNPCFKKSVTVALKKSEQGKNLTMCKNADDMFSQLGI